MEEAKADAVAEILVEGDLLGHTTHGLELLPLDLSEIEKKQMTLTGEPVVVADYSAVMTCDGRRLPGQWLTLEAIAKLLITLAIDALKEEQFSAGPAKEEWQQATDG